MLVLGLLICCAPKSRQHGGASEQLALPKFRPPYVCGQCHKAVYLCCMHFEGCGFRLPTLECPVHGRAHTNIDKWLFQKWCHEVDVEEVLTATLPKEHVSSDEELHLLSNPLLASPPDREVKKKEV